MALSVQMVRYCSLLFCRCKGVCLLRFRTKIAENFCSFHSATICDLTAKFSGKFMIFFCFLWSSSVFSWLTHCSSGLLFADSVWLWFEAKKLSNVQTCFGCDMLKIAKCIHHAFNWLSMRCTCSAERYWNMSWEWTLNRQCGVKSCFTLQFLYWTKSLLICFLSSFFLKLWMAQIVSLAHFFKGQFRLQCGISTVAGPSVWH